MNSKIKIDLTSFKEISWPVVMLFMAQQFGGITSKQMFIICAMLLIMLVGFMKIIIIPKIRGLNLYIFFIIYASVIGLMSYDARSVIRDLYYILPTIILIILGYYFEIVSKGKKSIMKTMVLCGTIAATSTFFNILGDFSILTEFDKMRANFDTSSYEVVIAFLIVYGALFTNFKIKLFRKSVNYYCFFIMFAQIILSLARSVWVVAIVGAIMMFFIDAIVNKNILNVVRRGTLMIIIVFLGAVFFYNIAPESAIEELSNKFNNMAQEMDSNQEIDSVDQAMSSWRGYENQSAKKQWSQNNILEELFGEGLGTGIYIKYVPHNWIDTAVNNRIPILHNGYYTILPKGGIVGVLALVWFMLANVFFSLRLIRQNQIGIKFQLMILAVIEITFMIQTFVVRGPISQSANLTWGILVGWICSEMNKEGSKIVKE